MGGVYKKMALMTAAAAMMEMLTAYRASDFGFNNLASPPANPRGRDSRSIPSKKRNGSTLFTGTLGGREQTRRLRQQRVIALKREFRESGPQVWQDVQSHDLMTRQQLHVARIKPTRKGALLYARFILNTPTGKAA